MILLGIFLAVIYILVLLCLFGGGVMVRVLAVVILLMLSLNIALPVIMAEENVFMVLPLLVLV